MYKAAISKQIEYEVQSCDFYEKLREGTRLELEEGRR